MRPAHREFLLPGPYSSTFWRVAVADMENVTVLRNVKLTGVQEHTDGTGGTSCGPEGQLSIGARFLVGCDGSPSTVRELLGVGVTGRGFRYDWLIVNTVPLDDLEWPPQNWQLCDPPCPTTDVSGGLGRRRRVFMRLLPHEEASDLNADERVWELLKPWGGISDNTRLGRQALCALPATWADTWNRARIAPAGNAAHQMPPFAGQGMCSGVRDAANLAGKLDLAQVGSAPSAILNTYTSERTARTRHALAMSVLLARVIRVLDPQEAAERNARMIAGKVDPAVVLLPADAPVAGAGLLDRPRGRRGSTEPSHPSSPVDDGPFDDVVGYRHVPLTEDSVAVDNSRGFSVSELGIPTGAWNAGLTPVCRGESAA